MRTPHFQIGLRRIGSRHPVYIIAEMSANHGQSFEEAINIIHAAHDAGADAVKIQTYLPDTMTLDCDAEHFQIGKGTIWEGKHLYDLYKEAYTPWEWQRELKKAAEALGMHFFSSPFDETSVKFLETLDVPAYKIASFELTDLPLIRAVARTGKPIIMSTGMASLAEIEEAVYIARTHGATNIALLKCTSAYPAPYEEMNLRTIPHMSQTFEVVVGLSDHSPGSTMPIAAVAQGACIIEKHITLTRSKSGPDSEFSMEPHEFRHMVEAVRQTSAALGHVSYEPTQKEKASRVFRRSLFVVQDVKQGELFTSENVRVLRPANGLPPKHLEEVLTRRATRAISRGTPLEWSMVSNA